jgi:peroxiredoxin
VSKKDFIVLGIGLLAGVSLGILVLSNNGLIGLVSGKDRETSGRSVESSAAIGLPAPDFELGDLDGGRTRLSDLHGKVVVLNFWATWCLPCKTEMPVLEDRLDKFRPRLEILAINFDEPPEKVGTFVDELGLDLQILLDPGAVVQDLYRVRGYPTTYFLDPEGVVLVQHIGLLTESQLDRYLGEAGLE